MGNEVPAAIQALSTGWEADNRKWLSDFRKALQEKYADVVTAAVLFGSMARGDWDEESDIDVLVIVRNDAADSQREIRRTACDLSMESSALPSVLTRTEDEWAARAAAETQWYVDVKAQGVSIL